MSAFRLPDTTQISTLHLNVRNLSSARSFYSNLLGFRQIMSTANTASFSASGGPPAQCVVIEESNTSPRTPSAVGLFHVAFLFPNRRELAKTFKRLYDSGYPFQGASDHAVSEALYLADPEGNGIELYADRPRDQWKTVNGEVRMVTAPLDLNGLIAELDDVNPESYNLHPDVHIGHIHLQVSSLAHAERFYHELLGFEVTTRAYPGALFVSAGGYHHHLGLNIWNSKGAPKARPNTAGLARFGIRVPDRSALSVLETRLRSAALAVQRNNSEDAIMTEDFDGLSVELHL